MQAKNRYLALISLCLIGSVASAQSLDHALWEERLLLLIAPSATDPEVVRQKRALDAAYDAVLERRLRVIELYADPGETDAERIPPEKQRAIRERLGAAVDTREVILVGLDGGIKRRAPLATPLSEVLQQIDGMPMRRQEIEDRRRKGLPITQP